MNVLPSDVPTSLEKTSVESDPKIKVNTLRVRDISDVPSKTLVEKQQKVTYVSRVK
ncbi:MAG: hypothetical protein AB3K77_02855 [Methanosarcinaceae archaeon]|uniref:hypothetical protein n=1 Tax=unclassified Methanosarcina TaxID=2644672 RepID=UPI000A66CF37|nr:hypothetical protein [Methanosarcina sp. MTP4]